MGPCSNVRIHEIKHLHVSGQNSLKGRPQAVGQIYQTVNTFKVPFEVLSSLDFGTSCAFAWLKTNHIAWPLNPNTVSLTLLKFLQHSLGRFGKYWLQSVEILMVYDVKTQLNILISPGCWNTEVEVPPTPKELSSSLSLGGCQLSVVTLATTVFQFLLQSRHPSACGEIVFDAFPYDLRQIL